MTINSTAPEFDITVTRVVPADPQVVWDYLTDVSHMGELSPENTESRWLDDDRAVGARFKGRNKLKWLSWTTVATVTAWEPGRLFSFESSAPSRTRWSYALEPVERRDPRGRVDVQGRPAGRADPVPPEAGRRDAARPAGPATPGRRRPRPEACRTDWWPMK